MSASSKNPKVVVIIGSKSDLPVVKKSKLKDILNAILGKDDWKLVSLSAHRHATLLDDFCKTFAGNGTKVFITAASKSAILSGAVGAAVGFSKPVIGVALPSEEFPNGLDALLAQVNNPGGAATVVASGIGAAGLQNAAIAACQIIGTFHAGVQERLEQYFITNTKQPVTDFEDQDAAIESSDVKKP